MHNEMYSRRENTQNNIFNSHKPKGFQAIRLFSSYWNEYTGVGNSTIQQAPDTLAQRQGPHMLSLLTF